MFTNDFLCSLMLLLGLAALVIADDCDLLHQLRQLANRWISR